MFLESDLSGPIQDRRLRIPSEKLLKNICKTSIQMKLTKSVGTTPSRNDCPTPQWFQISNFQMTMKKPRLIVSKVNTSSLIFPNLTGQFPGGFIKQIQNPASPNPHNHPEFTSIKNQFKACTSGTTHY